MNTHRRSRSLAAALSLLLVPAVTLAEVSVQLDHEGKYKRYFYLTRGNGSSSVVWTQVRPSVPLHHLLNPLGDNLGDLAPIIRTHPVTGYPWVVWARNIGNQKQLGFALWDGAVWSSPAPIAANAGPLLYDELDPDLTFDGTGTPYLVWWRAEQFAQVYFSTIVRGVWTPPLRISVEGTVSRTPTIALDGTKAIVTYQTESGPTSAVVETAVLIQSATNLMDSPTPPLYNPPPAGGTGGSPDPPSRRR
jgi:hypothetical protein